MIEDNKICKVCGMLDKCPECKVQLEKMTDKQYDEYLKSQFSPEKLEQRTIFLIGSTKYRDEFFRLEKDLTFKGYTILIPYVDGLMNKENYSKDQWEYLMGSAFQKIRIADIIFVVNKDGYIGDHTAREVEFAKELGKEIQYLVNSKGDEKDGRES